MNGGRDIWGDSFNGPIGGCAARPPWSWDEADDGIAKGDWFRDPLRAYAQQLWISGFSGHYIHNPYLESAEKSPSSISLCRDGNESTTVSKAMTNTLWGIAKVLLKGGLKKNEIRDRAGKLFLTNTVLLEWVGKTGLENWNWSKAGPAEFLPSFSADNEIERLRIPAAHSPGLISPAFKAPARYFNQLVIRYRSAQPAQAMVSWQYDGQSEFQENQGTLLELQKAEDWTNEHWDLSTLEQWDAERSIAKIKLEVMGNDDGDKSVLAFFKELFGTADSPVEIAHIVLDRKAFADTFAR
jgi:hypothetical protein